MPSEYPPLNKLQVPDFLRAKTDEELFREEVKNQERRIRARAEALDNIANEGYETFTLGKSAAELLQNGVPEVEWTIKDLAEKGQNTLIIGDFKSGKSTIVTNVLRCLADAVPMFGEYPTRKIEGRIAYIDLEMGETKTLQRIGRAGISQAGLQKIHPISLLGKGFNVLSDLAFENLVKECVNQEIEAVMFDPLMHVAPKESENDNAEAQRIIARLEEFKEQSGVTDIFAPAHSAKRPGLGDPISVRGASAWDGWAGYRWYAYHEERNNTRYFKLGPSREMSNEATRLRRVEMGSNDELTLDVTPQQAKAAATAGADGTNQQRAEKFVRANEPVKKGELLKHLGGDRNRMSTLVDEMVGVEFGVHSAGNTKHIYLKETYDRLFPFVIPGSPTTNV